VAARRNRLNCLTVLGAPRNIGANTMGCADRGSAVRLSSDGWRKVMAGDDHEDSTGNYVIEMSSHDVSEPISSRDVNRELISTALKLGRRAGRG
jgi:hypothetical protein